MARPRVKEVKKELVGYHIFITEEIYRMLTYKLLNGESISSDIFIYMMGQGVDPVYKDEPSLPWEQNDNTK